MCASEISMTHMKPTKVTFLNEQTAAEAVAFVRVRLHFFLDADVCSCFSFSKEKCGSFFLIDLALVQLSVLTHQADSWPSINVESSVSVCRTRFCGVSHTSWLLWVCFWPVQIIDSALGLAEPIGIWNHSNWHFSLAHKKKKESEERKRTFVKRAWDPKKDCFF